MSEELTTTPTTETVEQPKQVAKADIPEDVKAFLENPDKIRELLTQLEEERNKRKSANSESAERRVALKEKDDLLSEREKELQEFENRLKALEADKAKTEKEKERLLKRDNLNQLGIQSKYLDHAEKLIEIPETQEEKNALLERYRAEYPQWFGDVKRIDTTGAITAKTAGGGIEAKIADAKRAGNFSEVMQLIRERDERNTR